MSHTFHIPVLGLGYSIDTPLKVARYGISSVMSIVDDELIERIREYHTKNNNEEFVAIPKPAPDSRAKRITAYLNMVKRCVEKQFKELKQLPFEAGNDLCRYFELLPDTSQVRQGYELMMEYPDGERKRIFQDILRSRMTMGSIDVNIMAKVDKMNFDADGIYTGNENTDALSSLRGFAESELDSSIILSAGMNPRLYSYIESFADFFPDGEGKIKKRIILKVSDHRSALIQAKFLAKKGLWVSEFRIESGLNCGGHAFATEGLLLGPILEEFKQKRHEMLDELFALYEPALLAKQIAIGNVPQQRVSVQGGIGTAAENEFLIHNYQLDATGWGSPFLLVPEATNVDEDTLLKLVGADETDYYLSNSSPLGILFNNFKHSGIEEQRLQRLAKGRPGSPCTKKYLCTNTEFTEQAICTASREYQNLKIKQLTDLDLPKEEHDKQLNAITEKICLCEGLCASTYVKYGLSKPKESQAVAICPGPNLAYFGKVYSLDEMVSHIYGRINLLENIKRPHVFIKELELYIDYLHQDIMEHIHDLNDKKKKYFNKFKAQLHDGIAYYKQLWEQIPAEASGVIKTLSNDLHLMEAKLNNMLVFEQSC